MVKKKTKKSKKKSNLNYWIIAVVIAVLILAYTAMNSDDMKELLGGLYSEGMGGGELSIDGEIAAINLQMKNQYDEILNNIDPYSKLILTSDTEYDLLAEDFLAELVNLENAYNPNDQYDAGSIFVDTFYGLTYNDYAMLEVQDGMDLLSNRMSRDLQGGISKYEDFSVEMLELYDQRTVAIISPYLALDTRLVSMKEEAQSLLDYIDNLKNSVGESTSGDGDTFAGGDDEFGTGGFA